MLFWSLLIVYGLFDSEISFSFLRFLNDRREIHIITIFCIEDLDFRIVILSNTYAIDIRKYMIIKCSKSSQSKITSYDQNLFTDFILVMENWVYMWVYPNSKISFSSYVVPYPSSSP